LNFWTVSKCDELSIEQIFNGYDEAIDPKFWREQYIKTILRKYKEIEELCDAYSMSRGMCLLLNNCWSPLQIGDWLKEQFYCGCLSPYPYELKIVQNEKHKILIAKYDAESG